MNKQAVLKDGSIVYFAKGRFDNFFVKIERPDGSFYSPKDCESFSDLLNIPEEVATHEQIWYYLLGVSSSITRYSRVYDYRFPVKFKDYEYLLAYFVAAMIAEENIATTRLGKRIKLLGLHQVLIEGMRIEDAADFSKGLPWRVIHEECVRRGF